MTKFLHDAEYPYHNDPGRYKYAPYRDLIFSYLAICAAWMVVAIPISPRKLSVVVSTSTVLSLSLQARPARFRCVFPYSLLLLLSVVRSQAPS